MSDSVNDIGSSAEVSAPEQSAQEVINTIDAGESERSGNIDVSESIDVEAASDSELTEVISDDDASAEEVAEAKHELAKRLSLKINGEEREFDLGSDTDIERLREMAQKGEGADQKFQEAAKIRKQMESFVELMQKDPIKALQQLGHDPDAIAEMHMQQRIEEMKKSPEQLEREKLQKELEAIRQEKEALENEKFEAEQQRIQNEYARQLDDEITSGLESSELPKSPYVVKRIAELLMMGLEQNSEITVQDVLPLAERQIKGEIQQMFGAMPEDVIEKILGDDVSNKLRKRRLSKMKKAPESASTIKATGTAEINAAKANEKKEATARKAKDFFKNFGDL